MKKYFAYDAYENEIEFFDTLEAAKAHHISNCENFYEIFCDSDGSRDDLIDALECGIYGEVVGFSTCERRKPTEEEMDDVGYEFDFYVEPPVLTELKEQPV